MLNFVFVKKNQVLSKEVIIQELFRKDSTDLDIAIRYYSLLSVLFSMKLTVKEIELLAFTAVKGITSPPARNEFITLFNTSRFSMENIKGKLIKKNLLVRVDKKYKVNPKLHLDFTKDITLNIKLNHTTTISNNGNS